MSTEPIVGADKPERTTGRWSLLRVLPVGLWITTTVLVVAGAITSFLDPTPDSPGSPDALFVPLLVALVTSLGTVGALLALRRAGNPIGWLMVTGALLIAFAFAVNSFEQYSIATGRGFTTQLPVWVSRMAFQAGLVLQVIVVLVFPDGALPRRGSSVLVILLVGLVVSSVGGAIQPTESESQGSLEALGGVIILIGTLLATLGIFSRLRAAHGDERKQLEWFAWVAAVLAVALVLASVQLGPVSDFAWVAAFVAFAALPIAIAIAVMKYRLYEIDNLVSRTLVYAPLIGILGGIYAAGTFVLQRLFVAYTGDTSDAAVVMATLIVAGTFTPVRKALEGAVERRFSGSAVRARRDGPPAVDTRTSSDVSALLDDPRLASRIEDVVTRVIDDRMRQ